MTLQTTVQALATDAGLMHDVIHGAAVDTVITDGGTVKTVAGAIATIMLANPRGAWVTATAYALKDVVIQTGIAYVCTIAHTSGTFATDLAADKWAVHQGATLEDLADTSGSDLVGHSSGVAGDIGITIGAILRGRREVYSTQLGITNVAGDEAANTALAQAVLDAGDNLVVLGQIRVSHLMYTANGGRIRGTDCNTSIINCGTSSGYGIYNRDAATTTLLWCRLEDVRVVMLANASGCVDWRSMQHSGIARCFFYGNGLSGQIGVRMLGVAGVTECTYNDMDDNYFGNVQYGYYITDGANGNTVTRGRAQLAAASAIGCLLTATADDLCNGNKIIGFGAEYPGGTMVGVQVNNHVWGTQIFAGRFEALLKGVLIQAGAKNTTLIGSYYSGCTTDWQDFGTDSMILEGGRLYTHNAARVEASYDTTSTSLVHGAGSPVGCTVTRGSAGVCAVSFSTAAANTGYRVSGSSSASQWLISAKSTSGFTVTTRNTAGTAVDAAVDFQVSF